MQPLGGSINKTVNNDKHRFVWLICLHNRSETKTFRVQKKKKSKSTQPYFFVHIIWEVVNHSHASSGSSNAEYPTQAMHQQSDQLVWDCTPDVPVMCFSQQLLQGGEVGSGEILTSKTKQEKETVTEAEEECVRSSDSRQPFKWQSRKGGRRRRWFYKQSSEFACTLSWVRMFSDSSLTELLLMTLKSHEQKTFMANMPLDLSILKLWPNDFDILSGNKM